MTGRLACLVASTGMAVLTCAQAEGVMAQTDPRWGIGGGWGDWIPASPLRCRAVPAVDVPGCRRSVSSGGIGVASGAMAGASPLRVRRRLAGDRAPDRVALAEGSLRGGWLLRQAPSPRILQPEAQFNGFAAARLCGVEDVSQHELLSRQV